MGEFTNPGYVTGQPEEKVYVEAQERTFKIVKNFIRCQTCVRNLDLEKMKRGWFVKNYCNCLKEKLCTPFEPEYDIKKDREKAQKCAHYLPESLSPAAILNDYSMTITKDIKVEVPKQDADNLNSLFY